MKVFTEEEITGLAAVFSWPQLQGNESDVARARCIRHNCLASISGSINEWIDGSKAVNADYTSIGAIMAQCDDAAFWIAKLDTADHCEDRIPAWVAKNS